MRFTKILLASAFASLCSVGIMAQDCGSGCIGEKLGYKPYPYWFIQAQGGVNSVLTDVPTFKHLAPTASFAVGGMFTPVVGVRLHFNGWKTTGAFNKISTPSSQVIAGKDIASTSNNWEVLGSPLKYSYNYITSDLDLMVNVFNIFSKNVYSPLNLYFIGGLGLSYAWNNGEFENVTNTWNVANDISNAWGPNQTPRQSLLSHNLRFGLLLDYNICKNFSAGIEVDANSLTDRFNSKFNDSDDWMLTAQLSLTYKFGFKKPCQRPAEPVAVALVPEPEPVKEVEPVKKVVPATPIAKVEDEPLKETIFYEIREDNPNPEGIISKVVAWAKKYPNKTIEVAGYADKGTGNPSLNVGYAKQRAESVKNTLVSRGIPEKQLVVTSYGDKVQPFGENDKNRCVIIIGK